MKSEYIFTLYLSSTFLALFAVAELLHVIVRIKAEITRKIVHIGTGILTTLFPIMVKDQWLVLLLCASFALILTLSKRFNFLKGINGIDRKSHGSISYPLAVYLTYLFYDFTGQHRLFFYLPILTMAFADPIAALVGKKTGYIPIYIFGEKKTIGGFLGFFSTSIIVTSILLLYFPYASINSIILVIVCALFSASTELITPKGLDNLTIPFSVILSLIIAHYL
jgi:dolichol kinase